jgi:hypothetical protein
VAVTTSLILARGWSVLVGVKELSRELLPPTRYSSYIKTTINCSVVLRYTLTINEKALRVSTTDMLV